MKKIAFFFIVFLVILSLYVLVFWKNKDEEDVEIDISDTGFEYDVAICDKYFEAVGCIIDNDRNQSWNQQMKQELRGKIKSVQEEWKQFNEEELVQNCTNGLENLRNSLKERNLDSFGCFSGVN